MQKIINVVIMWYYEEKLILDKIHFLHYYFLFNQLCWPVMRKLTQFLFQKKKQKQTVNAISISYY